MPDIPKVGFVPKAALVTARIIDKPFEVPTAMTGSAVGLGAVTHTVVGKFNQAAKEGFDSLQPRGPLTLFNKLFDKVDAGVAHSANRAATNTTVFWAPMSKASSEMGQSLVDPLAMIYAKKAGFPEPSDLELLAKLVHSKGFPTPPPPAEGTAPATAPAGDTPPPAPTPTAVPGDGAPAPTGGAAPTPGSAPTEEAPAPTASPTPADGPPATAGPTPTDGPPGAQGGPGANPAGPPAEAPGAPPAT